jgi:hypothetical protein
MFHDDKDRVPGTTERRGQVSESIPDSRHARDYPKEVMHGPSVDAPMTISIPACAGGYSRKTVRVGNVQRLTSISALLAVITLISGCSSTHSLRLEPGASTTVDQPVLDLDPGMDHVHAAVVHRGVLLLGTHTGLVEVDPATGLMAARSASQDDFMALASGGSSLIASGHPGRASTLPDPLGLMRSEDGGVTWQEISLSGQVDFHGLAMDGSRIAGIGTKEGVLVSDDAGRTWKGTGVESATSLAWFKEELWISTEQGPRILSSNAFREAPEAAKSFILLASSDDGRALWSVAQNGSVWRTLDGSRWQEFGSINAVEAFAATADTAYALTSRSITVIKADVVVGVE